MNLELAGGELLVTTSGQVAVVTLNRPESLNALTLGIVHAVEDAMLRIQADDSIRVAVLTGAGGRAFCAGGDLGELLPMVAEQGLQVLLRDPTKRFFSDVFKPIVAAVQGPCMAGGLELLLGTDIRIAGTSAYFGLGEVRWGVVPAAGSHIRLPRQIPWAVAMEMLLGGRRITAERAREVGLVNEVVDESAVLERAMEWAQLLCGNAPLAMQTAKEIAVRGMALEAPFALEASMASRVFDSRDAVEGPKAFVERRKPRFEGR